MPDYPFSEISPRSLFVGREGVDGTPFFQIWPLFGPRAGDSYASDFLLLNHLGGQVGRAPAELWEELAGGPSWVNTDPNPVLSVFGQPVSLLVRPAIVNQVVYHGLSATPTTKVTGSFGSPTSPPGTYPVIVPQTDSGWGAWGGLFGTRWTDMLFRSKFWQIIVPGPLTFVTARGPTPMQGNPPLRVLTPVGGPSLNIATFFHDARQTGWTSQGGDPEWFTPLYDVVSYPWGTISVEPILTHAMQGSRATVNGIVCTWREVEIPRFENIMDLVPDEIHPTLFSVPRVTSTQVSGIRYMALASDVFDTLVNGQPPNLFPTTLRFTPG